MDLNIVNFVGIDISKSTFDIALIKDSNEDNMVSTVFSNNPKGLVRLEEFLKKQSIDLEKTLFCMEATGIYSRLLSHYLAERKYNVWVEMPVKILRSLGIQRGKSDHLDAKNIAKYALTQKHKAQLWEPPRDVLIRINDMLTLRERLVNSRKALIQPIKELEDTGFTEAAEMIKDRCQLTLDAIDKEIILIEKELDDLINNDSNLKKLYSLARSVTGIGRITALMLLYYTNEFKLYFSPKQLACYCGVAPYAHTSGTSIRGRSRVSHFANKKLKKLLHLVALTSIRADKELNTYYQRKVAEGKNKMLVINAIRNKILHRLCAVINRGTPFILDYNYA